MIYGNVQVCFSELNFIGNTISNVKADCGHIETCRHDESGKVKELEIIQLWKLRKSYGTNGKIMETLKN